MTVTGTTLGSVHYFSPEQAKGETTTGASDVYSLGLVLYEALTGQRAWRGETTASLAAVRIGADAPSPRAIRPEISSALDAVVVRALDADPARRFASGVAMAAALEPIVSRPDPASPTVGVPTAALAAGAAAATAAAGFAGTAPIAAPPMRPASREAVRPAPISSARRATPAIAGPLVVLGVVAAVVVGGLFVASLPGRADSGAVALPTRTPTPEPTPTPRPTAVPTVKPTKAPDPTPIPKPGAKPVAGTSRDLCDPILGFACGLEKGTYDPSRFEPAIRFKLRDGWSTSVWESDLIVIGRPEGAVTFASGLTSVYPQGDAADAPRSARLVTEAFIGTDGVAAARPKSGKVGGRKATVVDLSPTGPDRVPLFGTSTQTFYLEPFGSTRILVIDGADGVVVIAIEPADDSTIESLLPEANRVVSSVRFR
jgi:hypothetical protein